MFSGMFNGLAPAVQSHPTLESFYNIARIVFLSTEHRLQQSDTQLRQGSDPTELA